MYFQLTPPSIPQIRAKFIIEKLANYPQNIGSINIFATGRTHSGKTTLGNRLLGIEYFLSTGRQDCTKEINLIEFPIGLKYFDLPGICSDDFLENYNRVSLGMTQVEEFPLVSELTLAKYQEYQSPFEQNLSIGDYAHMQFQPDLIYYLIAPDKQFARGDRKYLKDLLKRHQNIIYVFNMFVNKQTGISYAATEANIQDVATQILKIHRDILGENFLPKIVGVNCWTGEGISELLHQSQQILSGEKGKIFQELIEYQQQKTPDEYVSQIKRELIRLYAYSACERPNGSDTCDQPLHKICYTLFDFLVNLPVQSEQTDNSISQQVNEIVNQVFSEPIKINNSESLDDKIAYVLRASDYILNESIGSFNELIKTYISEVQNQGNELKDQELEEWQKEKESYQQQLEEQWDSISLAIDELKSLNQSIQDLDQNLGNIIDEYNYQMTKYNSFSAEIASSRQNLNYRCQRWKERLDRYNANINKINRSSARLTYEAERSIEKESDYLDEERNAIQSEDSYLDSQIEELEEMEEYLEEEKEKIEAKITKLDNKKEIKKQKIEAINQKIQAREKFKKNAQDEMNFWLELLIAFEKEFNALDEKIEARIEEMNVNVKEIRNRLSDNYFEQFSSLEDAINELQEVINRCLDELTVFENQIFTFHQELNKCIFKLNMNKMVTQVLQKTTEHYFDETGEFEYRGSHYHYFRQHGITLGLALTTMILIGLEGEYENFYNNLLKKVERLGYFADNPVESQILKLLQSQSNSIFDSSFETIIKQAVL